jgi:hypothetical protein
MVNNVLKYFKMNYKQKENIQLVGLWNALLVVDKHVEGIVKGSQQNEWLSPIEPLSLICTV